MNSSSRARLFAGLAAAALAVTIAGPVAAQSPGASPMKQYKIGVSNPGSVGNGWREEMLCSAQAQGVASGQVSQVKIVNRDTDAAGQLSDIRDLISSGMDAILINPVSPDALNPAIKEATDKGIVVVAIDAPVTEPTAFNLSNDQENYGYLGASWLFKQLNGKGDVVYMRGLAGHPADTARDVGFKRALAENPGINIVSEVATGWDQKTATEQITTLLTAGTHIDGVWTSGIDNVIVDAFKQNQVPFVPIVGADNVGFVNQLLDTTNYPGLVGAAVTNPGSVGGAGVTLALQILNGQKPASNTVVLTPTVWDNTTDAGKAALKAAADPSLNPIWPLGLSIPDWTTYTKDQLLACKGPGE